MACLECERLKREVDLTQVEFLHFMQTFDSARMTESERVKLSNSPASMKMLAASRAV